MSNRHRTIGVVDAMNSRKLFAPYFAGDIGTYGVPY